MSKHTPGPWRIGRASSAIVSDTKPQQARDDESFELDRQHYGGYLIAESVFSEADAKLIAAAPDLLDTLISVAKDMIEHEYLTPETIEKMRTAAIKAGANP